MTCTPRRAHSTSAALAAALALGLAPRATDAVTLPEGFVLTDPFPGATFDLPLQVVFLPDGRSLVVEKAGRVWTMLTDATQYPEPFIDIRDEALNGSDLGLLGVAVDPDYETTPWVYFLLTVDPDADGSDDETDAYSRVVRYLASTADPNVADPASRQVLLGATWSEGIPSLHTSHGIGTLRFGADGSLLVSAGDGAHFEGGVDAGGRDPAAFGPGLTDPAEDIGAFRARSLNSLAGKVLRIDKDTGLGLPDNPYWDGDGTSKRSKVYVYGLRNPFRFTRRPGTGGPGAPGTLYIGDVGWYDWEEIDVARTGGINLGWPCYEGGGVQPTYAALGAVATGNANVLCGAAPSAEVPDAETPPLMYWNHYDDQVSDPPGWMGSAVTCGIFYTGTQYPPEYVGRYFVGDYSSGWLRTLELDAQDQLVAWEEFATGFTSPIVGLAAHPATGDLYLADIFANQIWCIRNVVVVGTDTAPVVARRFQLADPTPNPSSGVVSCAFTLPAPGTVTVDIFDPTGSLVRHLSIDEAPAGTTTVTWDRKDRRGRNVGPGLYFLRLVTPWGAEARKIVLDD